MDSQTTVESVLFESEDPRLRPEFVRYIPGTDWRGDVVLVGVVHDHPASVFRSEYLVRTLDPDVVAVELPPIAVPLFETFGRDPASAEVLGGEMSVALQAATWEKVGIDAPSVRYTWDLFASLVRHGVPLDVAVLVLRDLVHSYAQATWTLIAALAWYLFRVRLDAHERFEYDVDRSASPAEMAHSETSHIAQREAFMQAIESPPAVVLIDTVREETMAERLRQLRRDGDVLAVVGFEHLERITDRLTTETAPEDRA